ncbi:Uma2 family endonuclease [Roseiflexus sp.]|uniref:Uma2 family endonuclease n=1 Tax=Roseiflexus sp. TaxID=2562120 RepID=UPI00398AE419
MATVSHLVTADELLQMPDDGFLYELVRGELRRMSPASHRHGRIIINITTPLDQYVRTHNLGAVYAAETGFKLASDPDTVRAPDIAFIRRERVEAVGDVEGYWIGAPDLAVEVISPNDLYTDVEEKIIDFLTAGTGMVLVVNPRKHTVTVYRALADISILTEDDVIDGEEIVPGWTLSVRAVFM